MKSRKLMAVIVAAFIAFAGLASAPVSADKLRWKMASWFPKSLTQLGTLGLHVTETLDRVSGGEIELKYYNPGDLVPPRECFDSVATGAVDACWSTPGYWYGKNSALAMFAAVPFGPQAAEYGAWIYFGGGQELMNEIYAEHGLYSLICGVIAPEASGWFREEINSVEDLKGLKMRFFGLGAKVMEKVGVSTQLIPGGDIFPALELGSIDATEYSMPAIDLNLGFYQIAKHYYFPGWHQQSTLFEVLMNKEKWEGLTDTQRALFELSCGDNFRYGLLEGEAIQAPALKELQDKGVTIHRWSQETLDTLESAWNEVVAEESAANPDFKRVWDHYTAFREEYSIWRELGYL